MMTVAVFVVVICLTVWSYRFLILIMMTTKVVTNLMPKYKSWNTSLQVPGVGTQISKLKKANPRKPAKTRPNE